MKASISLLLALVTWVSNTQADILPGQYRCDAFTLGTKLELSRDGRSAVIKFANRPAVRLICGPTVELQTNSYDRAFVKECRIPYSQLTALWLKNRTASMGDKFYISLGAELKNMLNVAGDVEGACVPD